MADNALHHRWFLRKWIVVQGLLGIVEGLVQVLTLGYVRPWWTVRADHRYLLAIARYGRERQDG